MIFGGQIKGEGMRLFQVYSAGNFIEATPETPYFQIGESKYGKPVLDRVITPATRWTRPPMRAGVHGQHAQVQPLGGPAAGPGGLRANRFQTDKVVCIDENNPYFRMLHDSWGEACAMSSTASKTRCGAAAAPRCL
jgi:putative proteasome-type protease